MMNNKSTFLNSLYVTLEKIPLFLKVGVLLVVLSFVFNVWHNFDRGPMPIHEWRKTDSMSIASNYAKGGSFIEPETQWISDQESRKAVAEFPIYYYMVGKVWSVTGRADWIFKLGSILLLFTSVIVFSRVVNEFLKSQFLTVLFCGLIVSSPLLIAYADSGIPNPISFSLVLFSAYMLFRYIKFRGKWSLIGFFLCSTLAVLIKITALIAFASFAGAALLYLVFFKRNEIKAYGSMILGITFSLLTTLLLVYLWYSYAIRFNKVHNPELFSATIRPYWDIPIEHRPISIDALFNKQLPKLIAKYSFYTIAIGTILLLLFSRGKSYLKLLLPIQAVGVFIYLVLWLWVFDEHDYYLLEAYFFVLTISFVLFYFISRLPGKQKPLALFIITLVVGYNVLYTKNFTLYAFGINNAETHDDHWMSKKDKDAWGWFHYNHNWHLDKLRGQKKAIDKVIPAHDTVFCVSDPSPNTHLYTIDRIGYSRYSFFGNVNAPRVWKMIDDGTAYMLKVGNEPIDSCLIPFTDFQIYSYDGVTIYDLRPLKK